MKLKTLFLSLCLGGLSWSTAQAAAPAAHEDIGGVFGDAAYVEGFIKDHTPEEKERINMDDAYVNAMHLRGVQPSPQPEYLATAGGPGSGKSTILEQFMNEERSKSPTTNYVLGDPDQGALLYMGNTYRKELTCGKIAEAEKIAKAKGLPPGAGFQALLGETAYPKWRGASNYIATKLLNRAEKAGYNIAHGTTSTSPYVEGIYQKLKVRGRKITLLPCYATDETRVAALKHRAEKQGFCQVDAQDIINKGKMFSERLPIYFKYADVLHLYWRDHFDADGIRAATYEKGKPLVVHNEEAFQKFKDQYDHDRQEHAKGGKHLPTYEEVEKSF